MKRFTIPCDFGSAKAPFHIYVGEPAPDRHPLYFQSSWLSNNRGGKIPQEVMDAFEQLHAISKEDGRSFEELCAENLGIVKKKEEEASSSNAESES